MTASCMSSRSCPAGDPQMSRAHNGGFIGPDYRRRTVRALSAGRRPGPTCGSEYVT